MKRIAAIWCAFVAIWCVGFAVACETPTEEAQRARARIIYFKDSRPNPPICYAYFWEGDTAHGGPALASVPCEAVKNLLVAEPGAGE